MRRWNRWGGLLLGLSSAACCECPAAVATARLETPRVETSHPACPGSSTTMGAAPPPTQRDPLVADLLLGESFDSPERFARSRYPTYPEDENIVVEPIAASSLTWVRDRTPRINGMWHLFERLPSGQARYVLCHATAEYVQAAPSTTRDAVELVEILQPLPAEQRVTYEFDPGRGFYVPSHCRTRVTFDAGGALDSSGKPNSEGTAGPAPFQDVPWDCYQHLFRCD